MAKQVVLCLMLAVVVTCLLIIATVSSHKLTGLNINETKLQNEVAPVSRESITTTTTTIGALTESINKMTTMPAEASETEVSLATSTTSIAPISSTATLYPTTTSAAPTYAPASELESSLNLNVNVNELSESEIIELLKTLEEPPSAPSPIFNFSAPTPTFEHSCAADEYQCLFTGECVPYVFVCDHHFIDCGDG